MQHLHPGIRRLWRLVGTLVGIPPLVAGVLAVIASRGHPVGWVALALGLAVLGLAAGLIPDLRYRHFRWALEEGILRIQRGVLFRTEAAVPAFRIQHVDLQQGPLDRWMGLQQLTVHTAAPAADIQLPGIASAHAPALRTRLLDESRAAIARYRMGDVGDAV